MATDKRVERAVEETITIAEFIRAIEKLPSDEPRVRPGVGDTIVPLKGRLGLFDVELPYEIEWPEDAFYPGAKR